MGRNEEEWRRERQELEGKGIEEGEGRERSERSEKGGERRVKERGKGREKARS